MTQSRIYLVTGFLALIAGIFQVVIGYISSMALLSYAYHALLDSAADFIAFFVIFSNKEHLQEKAAKIVGVLLIFAGFGIIYELLDRIGTGYVLSPILMIVGGTIGSVIDLFRMLILKKVKAENILGKSVYLHAKTDFLKSLLVVFVGVIFWLLSGFEKGRLASVIIDATLSLLLSFYIFYLAGKIITTRHVTCGDKSCPHHHHH